MDDIYSFVLSKAPRDLAPHVSPFLYQQLIIFQQDIFTFLYQQLHFQQAFSNFLYQQLSLFRQTFFFKTVSLFSNGQLAFFLFIFSEEEKNVWSCKESSLWRHRGVRHIYLRSSSCRRWASSRIKRQKITETEDRWTLWRSARRRDRWWSRLWSWGRRFLQHWWRKFGTWVRRWS